MKFLNIFNKIKKGNYALTDDVIYTSLQNGDELIPLYGGNKEHSTIERKISISAKTKKNQKITIFEGEGIIISLDGSAGCMTYKKNEKFALNHHAGFITVKDSAKNIVDLKYFALFFQNHYKALAVSDGSKTLSLQQIYSEELNLPSIDEQIRIVSQIDLISNKINALNDLKNKIKHLLTQDIVYTDDDVFKKSVALDTIVNIIQGHQITDEEIYNSVGNIPVLTGPNIVKGYWNKSIVDESDLPCITYATKAFDGTISIQKQIFDANNTAIMSLKKKYINKIQLEWLQMILPNLFLKKATSKGGVSYLNKEIVSKIEIDIPKINIQDKCIEKYNKLHILYIYIELLEKSYNDIFSKEIIFD